MVYNNINNLGIITNLSLKFPLLWYSISDKKIFKQYGEFPFFFNLAGGGIADIIQRTGYCKAGIY
jgi:hypothetical protein